MSECVVRMEMPESCFVCPFRLGCSAYRAYSFSTSTRRVLPKPLDEGCNILAVLPEGHGRLVDADEDVSKYITVWDCKCSEFGKQTVMAVDDMKYLPTVVPAEAERSEA